MRRVVLPDQLLLAVDTTFGACSAALLHGHAVLARRFECMQRGHAEALAPMVEALMDAAGISFLQLERLAVTTGPGSFTGQRVGLAFMRGLRIALAKPLVGVTSLAAMAAEARAQSGCAVAAAIHDAKRGEVYLETTDGPTAEILSVGEAQNRLKDIASLALAGTGAELISHACPQAVIVPVTAPDAVWVGRLASENSCETEREGGAPRPLYLRPPDAKLPGGLPVQP